MASGTHVYYLPAALRTALMAAALAATINGSLAGEVGRPRILPTIPHLPWRPPGNSHIHWWHLNTSTPHMACYAPKTGCTLWKALMEYINYDRYLFDDVKGKHPGIVHQMANANATGHSYKGASGAKIAYFDALPKFVIVRNPYDRFLSSYTDWKSRFRQNTSFEDFVSKVERRTLQPVLWSHIDPISTECGITEHSLYHVLRLEEMGLWFDEYVKDYGVEPFLQQLERKHFAFFRSELDKLTTVYSQIEKILRSQSWSGHMATTSHARNSSSQRFELYTPSLAARITQLSLADFTNFGYPLWNGHLDTFRAF